MKHRHWTERTGLASLRRIATPVTAVTLFSFLLTTFPPRLARAEGGEPSDSTEVPHTPGQTDDVAVNIGDPAATAAGNAYSSEPEPNSSANPLQSAPGNAALDPGAVTNAPPTLPTSPEAAPAALPSGADKSGVTSKSISVPKGAGTIDGMGESFSAQLSTGIATFSVPFALPAARGGAQPSLGLSYSSSGGFGLAGVGWQIGVPFIARQTDRGVPTYDDKPTWHPEQDRFVFNGGQELVPICTVTGTSCDGALDGEEMPVWGSGWQYFRPRVEGSFLRFFWSDDHLTWRVQDKSGVTMELGVPRDGSNYTLGVERNPDKASEVFRWHLVRQYDTYGNANPASGNPQPANVVVYRYMQDAGSAYLSDIYDTPPADGGTASAATAPLSSYAHHTRLVYELRSDPTVSFRSGWKMEQRQRLARVDIASKTADGGVGGERHMVRRYHLGYDAPSHGSLLESVQVEGRCASLEINAPAESNETLPSTSCPRLPPMTFDYQRVEPFTTSGSPGTADLQGYEGFDERLIQMKQSPPNSVDEGLSDLFDINSDSLPDVLVTAGGVYGPAHGVFFNGHGGVENSFGAALPMGVAGVLGAGPTTITLTNDNVAPLDLDGDATINLLHMPKVKTYAVYTPVKGGNGWMWKGREVTTASGNSPKIDLGKDALETQVIDADFDGLVDVVVTTGTEVQTFFALGRYPGGDGKFGSGKWTSATTAALSDEPVRTCVPWSATPVRFSDSDIKVSDMNGDGIGDIVRVRKGDIRYWPGRGNGFWGTGKRDDCAAGTFGANRHLLMSSSPQYSDIQGESLRLDDVNGDGLSDLVQVRFNAVDVWLNVDGVGWTKRHIIENTPASPSYANRVRLVDINGSGTRDILWGNASNYQYMDLAGGERPWVLTHVDNGLGKTTDLEYSTSTKEMLAAEKAGEEWTTRLPSVVHVVKRVTDSDNLTISGSGPGFYITEYSYRDPVYDGRQREFRGFRHADATRIGDQNSPTDVTESTFLLGECVDESSSNGSDECSVTQGWRDNPREALKGLPVLTEKLDANGVAHTTDHTTYTLRKLYTGLDGREVRHAFESKKDTYLYDVADFVPAQSTAPLLDVVVEYGITNQGLDVERVVDLRSTAGRAHVESGSKVDLFGNKTEAVALGCTAGCFDGVADETITTFTDPTRPEDDPTGWLWRTGHSYVRGSAYELFLDDLKVTDFEYSPEGALLTTTHTLDHTLPLDRFHENVLKDVAPTPASASADGPIVYTNTYSDFGNLEREAGPNSRCRDTIFDEDYEQLATGELIYVRSCGSGPLTSGADYDRGFGLVTLVTNMQLQPTQVEYDSFGRLSTITKSDPAANMTLLTNPSVKIEYFLPGSAGANQSGYSMIHTSTQDAEDFGDEDYLETWAYVDGMGRTLVTLSEAEDGAESNAWIASGRVRYDGKGAVNAKFLDDLYTGPPTAFPFAGTPATDFGTQRYDAFGRTIETTDLDGTVTLVSEYHALATDLSDAADISGPHSGTPATEHKDGHGRTAATIERIESEERITTTKYLPTGEPQVITRELGGTSDKVVRWMRYDSLGRMVLNVEPNTSENFTEDEETEPDEVLAWRYAYNDSGDLVATSDARGCGVNFAYDAAGRLIWEDYSPCLDIIHADYSEPADTGDPTITTGVEVLYRYDTAPPSGHHPGMTFESNFGRGRLMAVYDRASLTVSNYDGLGRVFEKAVRVAKPGVPDDALDTRYTNRWYERSFVFDSADREIASTTGATVGDLQGTSETLTGSTSAVRTEYTHRGTVQQVSGSYGSLVASVARDPDGLVTEVVYGDVADTTTDFSYDQRRRLTNIVTARTPPAHWSPPLPGGYLPAPDYDSDHQPSYQTTLQSDELVLDNVGNPTHIYDNRDPDEWPADAKPVNRLFTYDDLYRLVQVDYSYDGDDTWVSPYDAENDGDPDFQDPRRAKPSPHTEFEERIHQQTFAYDWLGNTSQTTDDAHGFFDRSLGDITNDTANDKPYQLKAADNKGGSPADRDGELEAAYDATGNLVRLQVERDQDFCMPTTPCSEIFAYEWDEVGRLVKASRWDVATLPDMSDPLPADPIVRLVYSYNAGDQRVVKTAIDDEDNEIHTLYAHETLELRRAAFDSGEYVLDEWTEVPYLFAHGVRLARVAWEDDDVPTLDGAQTHVFFELGDHLGSTSVVLDSATGELVERGSTQAYGAAESDFRPDRWLGFREDYRFTGKEEDIEVGLSYFGKRFLSPYLNRWVSADPLTIHGVGADLNAYAYVHGRALKATDPLGLCENIDACIAGDFRTSKVPEFKAFGDTRESQETGTGDSAVVGPKFKPTRGVDQGELVVKGVVDAALPEADAYDGEDFERDTLEKLAPMKWSTLGAPKGGTSPSASKPSILQRSTFSLGVTAGAETGLLTLTLTPATGLPGGLGVAAGGYIDTEADEIGFYTRGEARYALGTAAGAGVEAGWAPSDQFAGGSVSGFAEGKLLGGVGVSAGPSGVSGSAGPGVGTAAGVVAGYTAKYALKLDPEMFNPAFMYGP